MMPIQMRSSFKDAKIDQSKKKDLNNKVQI